VASAEKDFPMKLKLPKNPFRVLKSLRLEVARLKADNAFLETRLAHYERMRYFINNNVPTEDAARACLMQLRVHGMTDNHHRTGYGVTAFIPEEVLDVLTKVDAQTRISFVHIVADELVRRALAGAHHVNSRGAISALLFEPLVPGKQCGAIGAIFDTPSGPQIAVARQPGEDRETHSQRQERESLTMMRSEASMARPALPKEAGSNL
jgi:hypothetical protein